MLTNCLAACTHLSSTVIRTASAKYRRFHVPQPTCLFPLETPLRLSCSMLHGWKDNSILAKPLAACTYLSSIVIFAPFFTSQRGLWHITSQTDRQTDGQKSDLNSGTYYITFAYIILSRTNDRCLSYLGLDAIGKLNFDSLLEFRPRHKHRLEA